MCIYLYISCKIKHTQTSHRHFSYLLCIMPIYVHSLYNAINFNKLKKKNCRGAPAMVQCDPRHLGSAATPV